MTQIARNLTDPNDALLRGKRYLILDRAAAPRQPNGMIYARLYPEAAARSGLAPQEP
jgi:hypothetical protein